MRKAGENASGNPAPGSPHEIANALRDLGYDIEPARPGDPPGSQVIARRDLGTRSILLIIDRSGRFRAEIAWLVGEWPSRMDLGKTEMRVVDRVTREVTVTGQLASISEALDAVQELGKIAPWASAQDGASPASHQ